MPALFTLFQSIIVGLISYKCYQFIYRLYFHPLSHVPGPWYFTLTTVYSKYLQTQGQLHDHLIQLHERYGSVVRIEPNAVSTTHATSPKTILTNSKIEKSSFTKILQKLFGKNIFTIIDRQEHSDRRRIVSHAFSQANLNLMEPIIWKLVDELMSKLETKAKNDELVNFFKEFHLFTADVIGELAFGQKFYLIQKETNEFMDAIQNSNLISLIYAMAPILKNFNLPFFKNSQLAFNYMNQFAYKAVQKKMEANSPVKDIMYYYLNAKYPETGLTLSDEALKSEGMVLISGGVDSTSSAMSWCLYYMIKYPQIYQKVVDEIDQAKPVDENGDIKPYLWCRQNLPYLEAVIYETLRLKPPFSIGIPRTIPSKGLTIDDVFIPENVDIVIHPYCIQLSEGYYDQAKEFNPDRWFKDGNAKLHEKLVTFGKGSRQCIGKHLAWMEITMCLIGLLTKFDVKDIHPDEKQADDDEVLSLIILQPKSGRVAARLSLRQ